ncbi:MAG: hypothetical protein NTY17_15190 [Planctomycetia bacterium]|nr:hypothetical protein [Planctomycetia bacterium]
MPGLDTGAYLAVHAGPRGPGSNLHLNLDIPADWPPGEYIIRIRCAARPEAAPDRRFIKFSHRNWGDRLPGFSVPLPELFRRADEQAGMTEPGPDRA